MSTLETTFRKTKEELADKVRKLLAKAEDPATTPEEAEAFTAKAQQMMTKYAIDLAMVADPATADRLVERDWVVEGPYASHKVSIINAVARANDCRALYAELPGGRKRIYVVGFDGDVEWVETLFALARDPAGGGVGDGRPGEAGRRARPDVLGGVRAGLRGGDRRPPPPGPPGRRGRGRRGATGHDREAPPGRARRPVGRAGARRQGGAGRGGVHGAPSDGTHGAPPDPTAQLVRVRTRTGRRTAGQPRPRCRRRAPAPPERVR